MTHSMRQYIMGRQWGEKQYRTSFNGCNTHPSIATGQYRRIAVLVRLLKCRSNRTPPFVQDGHISPRAGFKTVNPPVLPVSPRLLKGSVAESWESCRSENTPTARSSPRHSISFVGPFLKDTESHNVCTLLSVRDNHRMPAAQALRIHFLPAPRQSASNQRHRLWTGCLRDETESV